MTHKTIALAGVAVLTAMALAGCSHTANSGVAPGTPASANGAHTGDLQPALQAAAFKVRGLYATGWSAGLPKKMDNLIATLHKTGLNSIVIDVKDSDGAVTYYTSGVPLAVEIGACHKSARQNRCPEIDATLKKLKDAHIYTIARVVCFNDPILARARHEYAIKSKAGGIWHNAHGPWVDPTIQAVWQYNVDIAIDAIKHGFDEIQWDYIRFPSEGNLKLCQYSKPTDHGQASIIIAQYLEFAQKALAQYHVPISADIFGLTGTSTSDMGIGQKINPIADFVNTVCPMVYPSHFAHGEYHMPNPNAQPYKTILVSLHDARRRLSASKAIIRPWLQAFTLGPPHYGPHEVMEQLRGVKDNNLSEFLWWSPQNKYENVEEALTSKPGAELLAQITENGRKYPTAKAQNAVPKSASATAPAAAHTPKASKAAKHQHHQKAGSGA